MKKITFISMLIALAQFSGNAQNLEQAFKNPPEDTRPGCYWYWINGNVSKEGITKDLEAMARVGIGRAYIGHIHNYKSENDTPVGPVRFMSKEWWEAVQWAVKEAGRCGVEIGFFNSPGWSQSGGPWVRPSQSMRYLASSEMRVEGGKKVSLRLPVPEIHTAPEAGGSRPTPYAPKFTAKDFQDVSVIAFPAPDQTEPVIAFVQINGQATGQILIDGKADSALELNDQPTVLDITLKQPETVQSIRLTPEGRRYKIQARVLTSTDGKTYRDLTEHIENRGHQGARREDPLLIPLPPVETGRLRLILSATSGTCQISELNLSAGPGLGHYVRKQLGETAPSAHPDWQDAYRWEPQPAIQPGTAIPSRQVIDLSGHLDETGTLNWDAPEGDWIVMRTGMVPMGTSCAPASPEATGLEVDKMSKEHVRAHFEGMMGEFLRRTPAEDRKALKYVIADSYETGPQNWTDGFAAKFEQRFGYSPAPYLPCIEGRVVDSPEISDRFLWDWRRLIAESIAEDYVGGLREVSNEHGLTLWLENYGHWGFPSEFLLYGSKSDQVGGEFWENSSPLKNTECRAAASCAHIYGRKDVYAEAFTSNRNFKQSPKDIKTWLDWVYGSGVNHLILHVFIHQPDERKPGIIQWFGTAFNRHNTWFEQSKAFVDYSARSAVLLKAGRPVIDVAYYIGQSAPVMTGPLDPSMPDGYDYDHINADVLINRAKVIDGRIAIQNGPSYALLVLPPEHTMTPEVLKAVHQLVEDGATILGNAPEASPSLAGYPEQDKTVRKIASQLWDSPNNTGKGRVLSGMTLEEAFSEIRVSPDLAVEGDDELLCAAAGAGKIGKGPDGGIVFKHRRTDSQDIYFLANTSDQPADFTASFRISGRRPSFWDAISGKISKARAFTQEKGRTRIPIYLEASESIYVVFGETIASDVRGPDLTNHLEYTPAQSLMGPWKISFDGAGAPETTTVKSLMDLSRHPNAAIRYFSGTAAYQTTVQFEQAPGDTPILLDLGAVETIAGVSVNGTDMGTVWTAPWQVDIGKMLKAGENTITIRVTSTWNNRLVADSELPPEKRQSYVSQPYRTGPIQPSGLMGPVQILMQQ